MIIASHFRDALFELDALSRYRHLTRFTEIDWSLKKKDMVNNAYRQCRRYFGKEQLEGIYGETPLQTLESIGKAIGLCEEDTFVDLGCGRGRLCFFAAERFQCDAVGIDLVPQFIRRAVVYKAPRCHFILDNFVRHVGRPATYYWYAYTRDEQRVLSRFAKGARVITLSEPIPGWECTHSVPALFSWGETTAYVQTNPYHPSIEEF